MHLKYISSTRIFSSRFTKIFLLFCACAFIGSSIGKIVSHNTARQTAASAQSSNWGLSFQEEGKRPVGNATIEELAQYNAFFAEDTEEKKIYLTFDAGFENGNTPAILDALKKHQAPATFFVVGNFISENKDLIKRMETEGHIVGNHTMTHPDMSKISTKESFQKELSDVEKIYREITGKEMTKFYRPPQVFIIAFHSHNAHKIFCPKSINFCLSVFCVQKIIDICTGIFPKMSSENQQKLLSNFNFFIIF